LEKHHAYKYDLEDCDVTVVMAEMRHDDRLRLKDGDEGVDDALPRRRQKMVLLPARRMGIHGGQPECLFYSSSIAFSSIITTPSSIEQKDKAAMALLRCCCPNGDRVYGPDENIDRAAHDNALNDDIFLSFGHPRRSRPRPPQTVSTTLLVQPTNRSAPAA
jgi:hypothetical protein